MKKKVEAPKAERTRLADIARSAGVSISTVSLVLNDKPLARNLAETTRERIRGIAKRLNYRPDAAARSLRSRRTQLIAVMVFDIADPYCTLILQGIQERLTSTGLLPIIMDAHNQPQQFSRFLGMALEHRVAGLIVVANWLFVDLELLRKFESHGVPTAVVGREFASSSISSVLVDNEAGGRLAFEHLHALGHTRIAVVRGPQRLQDSERRWCGIRNAARAANVSLNPHLTIQMPETSDPVLGFKGGWDAAKQFLSSGHPFTAVLAFDDLTAFGVIRALHEAGRRVPQDVSVVGFDDIPQALLGLPSLTTVAQHMRAMGVIATEQVLRLIAAQESGAQETGVSSPPSSFVRLHPPTLIARESTAKVNGKAKSSSGAKEVR